MRKRFYSILAVVASVLSADAESAVFPPAVEVVSRDAIYSIDDQVTSPNNQVHFPFMFESADGNWYMTLREGPHVWGPITPACRWKMRPVRCSPRTGCRRCIRRIRVSRGDRGRA